MKKTFTIVHSTKNLDTVAPINTQVIVNHEPSKYDDKALRAFLAHNNEGLGFVGQTVMAEGTESNSVLYDIMENAGKKQGFLCVVVGHEKVKMGTHQKVEKVALIVEALDGVEEEQSSTNGAISGMKFKLLVKGATRQYKGKRHVLECLINGESALVGLKMNDDKIIAYYDDEPAGEVDPKSPDFDMAVKVVTTLGEYRAEAVNPDSSMFTAEFSVDEETMTYIKTGKKVLTLQDVKEEKSQFIPMERLQAIHDYLESAGMTSKQIMKVMETYKEYPADVRGRIPEPKVLFNDQFNGVKKTVTYLAKGKHLRLIGEKGTGKNVLTEVLAWVYQRPLYELSMNSQTDKMDLLGSKTFETVVEDGKEITKITFQKEALVEAMEVGGIINLDEINAADPSVLILLHSATDTRRSIEVPAYGKVVADDNFQVILTMNKDYVGTTTLNEAFRNRFTPILFPNTDSIAQMLKIRVKGAKASEITACDKIYKSILTLVRDGSMSMDVLTIRGFIDALDVSEDLGLREALVDNVANAVEDDDYRITVLGIIEDNLG